ncbi:unnamed protein product [Peronospora effusa]|nr:unnamed protein product [Peronospora effusa]
MFSGQSARTGEFPIAVAASGGADSMALMLLLREYLQENRIQTPLLVVTVDHRLRLESSREALEVAKICADHGGIHHVTKVCDWYRDEAEQQAGEGRVADSSRLVKPRNSKMEEQARQYRYDLLRQACLEHRVRCLFVAHNRGDQIETMLFRLGRASGINGLAGIASQLPFFSVNESLTRPRGTQDLEAVDMAMLVRPLLSVTKDRLMATCNRFQQTWIHDPSNDNLMYDRVRIRQELKRIEREQGVTILDLFSRFQKTAEKAKKEFGRAERYILHKYTVTWEPDIVVMQKAIFHDPKVFNELLYRLLSLIIVHIGNKGAPPRLASVARLARNLQHLETGKQLTLGGCRKSEQIEVAPVPGFFGHVVSPGHPLRWANDVEEFCMQLNSAALGADASKGRSTLSIVAKTSKITLCALTMGVTEQWNLTQTFTPMDGEIELVVDGPNSIHVTGFIEVAGGEDSGDEHDYDDNDDEEDEMMVFGDDSLSDVDADEEEEEDLIDQDNQDKKSRFEVLEERVHNKEPESKKKSPKKEAKKKEGTKKKEETKKEAQKKEETKKESKKDVVAEKVAAGTAEVEKKANDEKEVAKKKAKTSKLMEKEKRIAEKLAEVTATNPKSKKRAAPVESVEVPKKAKGATRVHKGVTIEDVAVGKGRPVQRGHKVGIVYRGRLTNGKQFDATQNRKKPFTFRHGIGDVIKGMDIGIEGMRVGSKRTITIPSRLGYGREGSPPVIPGNSDLIFEIEVVTA